MIDWTVANQYYDGLKRSLETQVIESQKELRKQLTEVQAQLGKERSCNEQQYQYIKFLKEQVKELADFRQKYAVGLKEATPKSSPANLPPENHFPNPLGDPLEPAPNDLDRGTFNERRKCSVESCKGYGQFQFCGIWICYECHRKLEIEWK